MLQRNTFKKFIGSGLNTKFYSYKNQTKKATQSVAFFVWF